jgi:ABC-type Fe3+ transport system substrate-binding protein
MRVGRTMTGSGRFGRLAFPAILALLVAGSALSPAAAEIKRTPQLQELVKAAEAEGVLNVVWGGASLGEAKGAAELQDGLNRAFHTHFKVNFTPGPSMVQMATRIIQEVKAGQKASSDAFLGVDVSLPAMIAAHVLDEVPWSAYFPNITPEMQTKHHEAVLVYTLFNGFAYNTQVIPDDKVPHKLADLFRPEWKGKLASTPYAAGFDKLALADGDAKIRPIVQKIAEWAGGLIRCGAYDRIASGEFVGLVLDCGQVSPAYMVENGGPVKLVPLDDALSTELTYFAIPKTSAHPNLAKLFAGFVATSEGQAIIAKYGATSHLIPGTPGYKEAKSLEARGLKLIIDTPDEIAPRLEQAEELKREYERILRGK